MAAPRNNTGSRFFASDKPAGVDENDWRKQELQRLYESLFVKLMQLEKENQVLKDRITTLENASSVENPLTSRVTTIEAALTNQDRAIFILNSQVSSLLSNTSDLSAIQALLNTTAANLSTLQLKFSVLTDSI